MEFHQLRYFVAAAEAGNFTQAAVRSHISQPSLSQQILKLEDELGQKLFNRLGRRVQLTPAGQTFYERARRILSELEDAARAVKDESGGGNLRFGVIPSVAPYILPTLMPKIRERLPEAHVEVVEDFGTPLLNQVGAGDLDAVIVTLPPAWPNIEIEQLYREPLLTALPEKHPLASKPMLTPRDLEGQSLILLGDSSSLGLQTRRFFGDHRINVEVACRCAQVQTVKSLVAAGIGLAIVPEMATDVPHPGVVFRELSGVVPQREIVLVRNLQRFRGRAEEAWLEILREYFSKLRHGSSPPKRSRPRRIVR